MIIPALLKIPKLRAKFIHSIKQNYFNELDISIPIQNNYWAKLFRNDSYDSFSEIFLQKEYEGFIPDIEINRIIDLGAHHGFFSVWLQCQRPKAKLKSLLVEPSKRCFHVLRELTQRKEYLNNFHFLNKCIGNPQDVEILFFDRPHMASSNAQIDQGEIADKVPILKSEDVYQWQTPPYDLMKCDIEGAENLLFENYSDILLHTKFVIMEWHGKKCAESTKRDFKDLNFSIIKSSHSARDTQNEEISSGIFLAQNNKVKK
jgi:FkbM family methyltransferase